MNLKSKFWIISLGFLAFAGLCGMFTGWYIWLDVPLPTREVLMQVLQRHLSIIIILGLFLGMAFLLLLDEIFRNYVLPLFTVSRETDIITTVNPAHRIKVKGSREIQSIAQSINEGAQLLQKLQTRLKQSEQLSNAKLEEERNTLAEVLIDLPVGIVVCNIQGDILLYNPKARELFPSPAGQGQGNSCPHFGIGRSIYEFVDGNLLDQARENLDKSGQGRAWKNYSSFTFKPLPDKGSLKIKMMPLRSPEGALAGYTLVFISQDLEGSIDSLEGEEEDLGLAAKSREQVNSDREVIVHSASAAYSQQFYDFSLFHLPACRYPEIYDRSLDELTYTVFDLETTGLDPYGGDEIVSLSAVRVLNCRILQEEVFDQLVNTRRMIPYESVRIHGIKPEMVKDKPYIEEILPRFLEYSKGTVLVAHNAEFDMRFLHVQEVKTGVKFVNPVLDTFLLSLIVHSHLEDHTLEGISQRLGTRLYTRHTSLGDAMTAAEIFINLLPLLAQKGITTLSQACSLCANKRLSKKYSQPLVRTSSIF